MARDKSKEAAIDMKGGSQEDRMRALEGALKQIEKDFGQGAIMRMAYWHWT